MNAAKYTGSEVKYIQGLSPVAIAAAGSGAAFNAGAYTNATMLVSANSADLTVNLQRSSTSNGTFANWGASVPGTASGLSVRSFVLNSSNVWYKVAYDNNNAGSVIPSIVIALQGAERTPIPTQDTSTTVYSTVLA